MNRILGSKRGKQSVVIMNETEFSQLAFRLGAPKGGVNPVAKQVLSCPNSKEYSSLLIEYAASKRVIISNISIYETEFN